MSDPMANLSIDNMTYVIDGNRLLGPINLEIATHGITVLMGANGAGKSLLLHMIHGLITPTSGDIKWNAQEINKARKKQSFIFQRTVIMRRSVKENVEYPLKLLGIKTSERVKRTIAKLEQVQLLDKADSAAASLSGGELQRMALARALITDPKILLLDEPTAHLDPQSTLKFEQIITDIKTQSVQIILTTHDIGQAKRMADQIVFMDAGQIIETSDALEFFSRPKSDAATAYFSTKGLDL